MSGGQLAVRWEDVMPDGVDRLAPDAPRIAVVVSMTFPGMGPEAHAIMEAFTRAAFQELVDEGAAPFLVDSALRDPGAAQRVAGADGVLFLGGGDVDSSLYGHTGPVPHEYGVDRAADVFCIGLLRQSFDADQPLLALCRGSQLLNVALGGTLVPDLVPSDLHKGGPGEPLFLDEEVCLTEGSKVAGIYGRTRAVVRSGHHQAVGLVAPGLRVAARAHDGVVEGTEHPGRTWVVGLQWHPEDPQGPEEDRRALFRAFAAQAAARAGVTAGEDTPAEEPVLR
jgi:putative glutamine amidotransferase